MNAIYEEISKVFQRESKFAQNLSKRVEDHLRMFARNFSNIDFFLKLLPLKDDELAMSEM